MTAAAQLVAEVARRGVQLTAVGNELRYKAPKGVMTEEIKRRLINHKPAILAYLRSQPANQTKPSAQPTRRLIAKTVFWRPEQVLTLVNTVNAQLGGEKSHAEALDLSLAWLELQHQIPVGSA
jgi:predicted metal-dependent hydrolase